MMLLPRLVVAALVIALAAMSVGTATAGAPLTFVVTRADDPAPDGCQAGDCSAREAFIASNDSAGTNTIMIPELHIELSIAGDDDTAQKGDLDITDSVDIKGVDPDNSMIDANQIDGVIDIPSPPGGGDSTAIVNIEAVGLTGGSKSGIHNTGGLSLENVVVFGNSSDADGGGINSPLGVLLMDHTTIGKNSAQGMGGGFFSNRSTTVRDSTIWVNNAQEGGGGVAMGGNGGVTFYRSTIHNNQAISGGGGGVLLQGAPGTFKNDTIADNSSSGPGGGILINGSEATADNTIIAGNTASNVPSECSGTLGGDYNLVEGPAGCTLTSSHNITDQDPLLSDLGAHGGPTQTRAILKDSPARDAGNNCSFPDQRGILTPEGAGCDIGSYEYIFLGDIDCDGFVTLADVNDYLRWLGVGGDAPSCSYRGDLQCNLDFGVTDVLLLMRALVIPSLPPPQRPDWCGEIGPFAP